MSKKELQTHNTHKMSRDQRNNINIYLFMELDDENHNNIKANGTCMRWNQ